MRPFLLLCATVLMVLMLAAVAGTARAAGGPITITPADPLPGATVYNDTPTIVATYEDSAGTVDPSGVFLFVNGLNVTTADTFRATSSGLTYSVPQLLHLNSGPNNATIVVSDTSGHTAQYLWAFTVNLNGTAPAGAFTGVSLQTILLYAGIAVGIFAAAFGGYYLYLKRTTRFAFRKYFATHPIQKKYLVIYVPVAAAFFFVLIGLTVVANNSNASSYSVLYVFIIAIFIALTALGIDSRRDLQRLRAYERAFAQFLFEMADAMRGGIAPEKAVVEIAKTNSNILQKPLRVAADGIRRGRPFDAVLQDMVKPMHSSLITRYASLIADATAVGGETSLVVYRAAKDMDDFVKIENERATQLALPVVVLYIAFGVLMAVIFALLYIAPSLETLNVGFINGGGNALQGNQVTTVPRLDVTSLTQRFFELMIIMSLGTGVIIGVFTEGNARYGILHALGLLAGTAIVFTILFPPV